ncbi:MAG: hypothetical protein ABEI77_05925 [Halorientalis sp.]
METRTQAEQIVVGIGGVVSVVALVLLGLAVYSLLGPFGLTSGVGPVIILLVFLAQVSTLLYASGGVEGLFEGQYRRRV